MWVKICANTTSSDARAAADAGADAVGFVFAPSRRQVNASQVREIANGLPPSLERVGVFAGIAAEEIAEAARFARLTAVQLHGGYRAETSQRLRELLGADFVLIETASWDLEDQARSAQDVTRALGTIAHGRALIDARVGGNSGGLGIAFDWAEAGTVVAHAPAELHVILAGGLRPETVAEAVRLVQPWGVDVASGVELKPGVKDSRRVREFIENARNAASPKLENKL